MRYLVIVAILSTCQAIIPIVSASDIIPTASAEPIQDIEEVEEVETVETVDVGETALGASQLIGRNHPAAVHLPIGLAAAALLVALLSVIRPAYPLGKSSLVLCAAMLLSFLPATLSGFLRAQELFGEAGPTELLLEHRNLMIGAFVITIGATVLVAAKRGVLEGRLKLIHLALLVAAFALLAVGGHHGGQMVYGASFLPY